MSTAFQQACTELKQSPKRWLVSGAAGFIGSHLVETLLSLGQSVVGVDNFATGHQHNLDDVQKNVGDAAWQQFKFIESDVNNGMISALDGVDYVLHQAALGSVPRSIEQPLQSNHANVSGFLEMLDAARQSSVKRFVYASSSSVYGDSPGLPKEEEIIGSPLSPYAVTKRVNELYARVFQGCYGLETIGLRYFNVFGPRQDPQGAYAAVIPRWIDALRRGEQCMIFGDGETSRDFCYIANVVQINLLAAVTQNADATDKVYNVAVGDRTTLNQLYALLAKQVSALRPEASPQEPHYQEFRSGDVRHSLADTTQAQTLLGYQPEVSVEEGIEHTVKWFLK